MRKIYVLSEFRKKIFCFPDPAKFFYVTNQDQLYKSKVTTDMLELQARPILGYNI